MKPEVEQELAHILLVELLAHQFTYPVKWIETQDVLLSEQRIERLIEVGPSPVLVGMAKRTIDYKYQEHDAALSIRRELLSAEKDADEVYYRTVQVSDGDKVQLLVEPSTPARVPRDVAPSIPIAIVPPSDGTRALHPDIRVQVSEIVRVIIAEKLKKLPGDVPLGSTIKKLIGGRSTLENEIVGDLLAEFESLPERPEDFVLDELCSLLETNFHGRLGKKSSALVARMISTRMPGGFLLGTAREHLKTGWSFGEGRQDAVLLRCLSVQPAGRLQNEEAAWNFLDRVCKTYVEEFGLACSPIPIVATQLPIVDSRVVERTTKQGHDMSRQKLELYAKDLQINLRAGDKAYTAARKELTLVQGELEIWRSEHGETYGSGIQPIMDPLKARSYDSSWNWAIQNLLRLYHSVVEGTLDEADPDLEQRLLHLANNASPKLVECMEYLRTQCRGSKESSRATADEMLEKLIIIGKNNLTRQPVFKSPSLITMPRTIINAQGRLETIEVPRNVMWDVEKSMDKHPISCKTIRSPSLRVRSKGLFGLEYNRRATAAYLCTIDEATRFGISFQGKHVLLTGAGKGSIGSEILSGLLAGGAKVLVGTSTYSPETIQYFQHIYASHGSRGSALTVVPFNQGSQQDVESLVAYIYDSKTLGWDLDVVLPFAAISESGRDITNIDSKSELAHRVMLTNTIRLVGAMQKAKQARGYENRPTQVVLPFSANHGTMGSDGLYAESKMALESLMNKWASEGMGDYVSICGASIGWTRGTGLMAANDVVAEGIEKLGVRTFSQQEMALNILALVTPAMMDLCQDEPLFADLNGGLETIPNLSHVLKRLRQAIKDTYDIRRTMLDDGHIESNIVSGLDAKPTRMIGISARANVRLAFPKLPDYEAQVEPLATQLRGMVDLERVVVIVGFAEIGPYGNSRTRWDMEAHSSLSLESCVELAWMMGLIKSGGQQCSWVDAKTGEMVHDGDIKTRYEKHIMDNCGIRLVESEGKERQVLQEIVVQQDLEPFNASRETAEEYQRIHRQNVEVYQSLGSAEWTIRIKAGATVMIPRAAGTGDLVAARIPTGWDPHIYGISDDIVSQVDPTTLYALVCTVEALLAAGITDFYEVYQYLHTTEVGNCIGSGMGGMTSSAKLFKDRFIDRPVQSDILQETFVNTAGAWINMLLLSSNGPIKTPVGACATSIESLDTGCDLIMSGKAKLCLVGGVDDFTEEVAAEFANMKATVDATKDVSHGRAPREMSRPMTSTRAGFVESHGCGVQVITSARLALDMGLPIHGIVAFAGTASDKIGRSVPAPGKGIVGFAAEVPSDLPSPLLSLTYRRHILSRRLDQIDRLQEEDLAWLSSETQSLAQLSSTATNMSAYISSRISQITLEAQQQRKAVLQLYGQGFYASDPSISPLRGSLAVWGLTADDIDAASLHGTSTPLGDLNETQALEQQFAALGRSVGNRVMSVCQKGLVGHGKGAAGAWALNGACQMLATGTIPVTANADNIDARMEGGKYLTFPGKKVEVGTGVKAVSVTSFGFGQKGAQAVVVNPKYLFASCEEAKWDAYRTKLARRKRKADGWFSKAMVQSKIFIAKETTPFESIN